jgi:hypothetical protein
VNAETAQPEGLTRRPMGRRSWRECWRLGVEACGGSERVHECPLSDSLERVWWAQGWRAGRDAARRAQAGAGAQESASDATGRGPRC